VALFGKASGTFGNAKGDRTNAHWELPASWRAELKGNQIAVWQIYADTKAPFEIIGRYTEPTNDNTAQGFGGVFFKAEKPKELMAWYDAHLGTQFGKNGYFQFRWREFGESQRGGSTTFGIFKASSTYFEPSTKPFMFNFRVRDLEAMLKKLKQEGVQVMDKVQSFDYGKFGWIVDPEGNKIELWQPINEQEKFLKK
jgi:predicted enzyme related to lactoylglutathione lyase